MRLVWRVRFILRHLPSRVRICACPPIRTGLSKLPSARLVITKGFQLKLIPASLCSMKTREFEQAAAEFSQSHRAVSDTEPVWVSTARRGL